MLHARMSKNAHSSTKRSPSSRAVHARHMATKIEGARSLVYLAAAKVERGEPDKTFFASSARCFASDAAMQVTTDAVQLFGGAGYTRGFPVERMKRDARITQIYEGTNQIQRMVMARALLKV
ncbi:acyl-CoA dehydrogenase family protein [Amycolatopsis carbonis]|uniref:acyl-CoA dehydrogenase family protein n=1 Tax=Amycolatopsis carbonis TaxID=715471 RepID=UPI003DA6CEB4